MVRKLALSLAVASAIAAGQANALGLGEIRVNSALNEPLDADIRLVQVRDLSAQQILPRMADIDEFSLAGLTKSRFLSDVKFQVKVAADGSGSIHVSSSVPVQEPFLSFLMEVNWPQGRLVREYTLLLDPPVFDPAPVTTAINAPAAAKPLAPAAAAPAPRPAVNNIKTSMGGGEIFVNNNDTLYVLAKNNRPASDISIEQMMIAMQRKNPDLFPTANINVMRAGKVMKLPTADEARALTRKQAIAEAARQTAEWKAGRRTAKVQKAEPKPAPAETPAAAPSGAAEGAPDAAESQLKIVTAQKPEAAPEPVSSDAAPVEEVAQEAEPAAEPAVDEGPSAREIELMQRNTDLENRLATTQESVDKVSRENAELGEKLDSIQEQLIAMQRLIELKDQQMATLQAEMLKQVQESNKPKPSAVDELINMLMANPLYLGGIGGVLVLLLALAALSRRRRSSYYEDEPAPRKPKASKKSAPQEDSIPEFEEPSVAAPAAAAVAGAAVAAAGIAATSAQADRLDDEFDELDLDMDLDLDEVAHLDTEGMEAVDPSELESGSQIDSVLDDILDEEVEHEPQEPDELDALLDSDADINTDLDELLEADFEDDSAQAVEEIDEIEEIEEDDELEGLEFAVEAIADEDEADQESGELIDEEFFSGEIEPESDQVAASAEVEEAELIDDAVETDAGPASALETVSQTEDLDDLLDDDLDRMLMESAAELEESEEAADEEQPDISPIEAPLDMLDLEPEAAEEIVPAAEAEAEEDDALDFNLEMPDEVPEADLDAMVQDLSEAAEVAEAQRPKSPGELVEEELTANIAHDLDMSLDDELDEMLSEDSGEIELVEEGDEEDLVEDDLLASLDGADEVETKLDLARAYIEMDDTDGARDILAEIARDGSEAQQAEAQSLLDKLK